MSRYKCEVHYWLMGDGKCTCPPARKRKAHSAAPTGSAARKARSSGYPADWKDIAIQIKRNAGWKCERCKEPHRVEGAFVLTVHHLDGNKGNCADWNLAALCQRCHLKIQGRVKMDQLFFAEILDVSEWFRPHLEGYMQSKVPNIVLCDEGAEAKERK